MLKLKSVINIQNFKDHQINLNFNLLIKNFLIILKPINISFPLKFYYII